VSLDGLITATTLPQGRLCRACFDGDYPLRVALAEQGKHLLERVPVSPVVGDPVVGDPVVSTTVAAGSAATGP
jgi:amidophosphoribosyltransferase